MDAVCIRAVLGHSLNDRHGSAMVGAHSNLLRAVPDNNHSSVSAVSLVADNVQIGERLGSVVQSIRQARLKKSCSARLFAGFYETNPTTISKRWLS